VLVLDEPTTGLDPAQRKEIRDLIRELAAGDRTVILSTHVLSEVEQLCERVIIIERGRIVAEDRIDALATERRRIRLEVSEPSEPLERALSELPGVERLHGLGGGRYELETTGDVRASVAQVAAPAGLLELLGRERLEDAYLRLTGGSEGAPEGGEEEE
jgi:ABC-2 type transport system ATP-binding protein